MTHEELRAILEYALKKATSDPDAKVVKHSDKSDYSIMANCMDFNREEFFTVLKRQNAHIQHFTATTFIRGSFDGTSFELTITESQSAK